MISCAADRQAILIGAVIGYLCGSVSFSRVVGAHVAPGEDLSTSRIAVDDDGTTIELRGVTPTAVNAHGGGRAMVASVALEAAKAAVPAICARVLLPGTHAAPAAATGAVVGHILPVWNGFRGGYGVSPMLGGTLALDPLGLLVTVGSVSAAMGLTREHRLMMLWPVTIPIWGAARGRPDLVVFGAAANAAYWARLLPEFRRGLRPLLARRRLETSGGLDIPAAERDRAARGQQEAEGQQHRG